MLQFTFAGLGCCFMSKSIMLLEVTMIRLVTPSDRLVSYDFQRQGMESA